MCLSTQFLESEMTRQAGFIGMIVGDKPLIQDTVGYYIHRTLPHLLLTLASEMLVQYFTKTLETASVCYILRHGILETNRGGEVATRFPDESPLVGISSLIPHARIFIN